MSRTPRLVLAAGAALLIVLWIASGSFLLALLVVVLVGGAVGLGTLAVASTRPRPEPVTMATLDLTRAPSPGGSVKRVLRRALARPWVRGDGLLRATATKLASEDALVFTPRGQRVAAPHLWVEWNAVDAAEVAEVWPLETLAREFADEYVEHARAEGTRRLADRTWVHVLGREDVPVGRVVVTAAFSEPQDAPLAAASSTSTALAPAPGSRPRPQLPPQSGPAPLGARARPADGRREVVKASFRTLRVAKDAFTAAVGGAPGREAPGREAPGREAPGREAPGREAPGREAPGREAPGRGPRAGRPGRVRTLVAAVTGHGGRGDGGGGDGGRGDPGPRAVLVPVAGGAGIALRERPLTIGRDPHADVVLTDSGVSWQHLTVGPAGAPTVTDHGSTNGTFVDGRRVQGPTALRAGQELALGREGPRFRLRCSGGTSRAGGTERAHGGEATTTVTTERTRQEAV